jgi:hypothetical protein
MGEHGFTLLKSIEDGIGPPSHPALRTLRVRERRPCRARRDRSRDGRHDHPSARDRERRRSPGSWTVGSSVVPRARDRERRPVTTRRDGAPPGPFESAAGPPEADRSHPPADPPRRHTRRRPPPRLEPLVLTHRPNAPTARFPRPNRSHPPADPPRRHTRADGPTVRDGTVPCPQAERAGPAGSVLRGGRYDPCARHRGRRGGRRSPPPCSCR